MRPITYRLLYVDSRHSLHPTSACAFTSDPTKGSVEREDQPCGLAKAIGTINAATMIDLMSCIADDGERQLGGNCDRREGESKRWTVGNRGKGIETNDWRRWERCKQVEEILWGKKSFVLGWQLMLPKREPGSGQEQFKHSSKSNSRLLPSQSDEVATPQVKAEA